jgi:hypothetical protein
MEPINKVSGAQLDQSFSTTGNDKGGFWSIKLTQLKLN